MHSRVVLVGSLEPDAQTPIHRNMELDVQKDALPPTLPLGALDSEGLHHEALIDAVVVLAVALKHCEDEAVQCEAVTEGNAGLRIVCSDSQLCT